MAKHFLRVEIGDTDCLPSVTPRYQSQTAPVGETESIHVGCTDELFTRRPQVSVRPIGFVWMDRVQHRVKILSTQLTWQMKSHKDLQGIN